MYLCCDFMLVWLSSLIPFQRISVSVFCSRMFLLRFLVQSLSQWFSVSVFPLKTKINLSRLWSVLLNGWSADTSWTCSWCLIITSPLVHSPTRYSEQVNRFWKKVAWFKKEFSLKSDWQGMCEQSKGLYLFTALLCGTGHRDVLSVFNVWRNTLLLQCKVVLEKMSSGLIWSKYLLQGDL